MAEEIPESCVTQIGRLGEVVGAGTLSKKCRILGHLKSPSAEKRQFSEKNVISRS